MGKVGIRHLLSRCYKEMWYVVPALIGLVYFLSAYWFDVDLPAKPAVLGVTRVLSLMIIFILIDRLHHHDGYIVIKKEEDKKVFSLELDIDPDEIEKRELIHFKVWDHSQGNHTL